MHRAGRREERERRRDDFVAATDVERAQRKQDGIGAVRAADRVLRVRQRRDGLLELLDGLTENEQLIIDDAHHRAHDLVLDGRVLCAKVEKRNRTYLKSFAGE